MKVKKGSINVQIDNGGGEQFGYYTHDQNILIKNEKPKMEIK